MGAPVPGRRSVESPWLGRLAKAAILVVLVGTLVSLAGPSHRDPGDLAPAAKVQLSIFASAIDIYVRTHGKLPASVRSLTETAGGEWAIMEKIPLDPWGNEYQYGPLSGGRYLLRSFGQDGLPDTEDDLVWSKDDDR